MSDIDDLEADIDLFRPTRRKGNNMRHRGQLKTHCRRGHPLTPDNIYTSTHEGGYLARHCKKCKRLMLMCKEER